MHKNGFYDVNCGYICKPTHSFDLCIYISYTNNWNVPVMKYIRHISINPIKRIQPPATITAPTSVFAKAMNLSKKVITYSSWIDEFHTY